ncbi:MAG TPA: universal stress protein [Blastocatellia bacterium]
MRILIGYDGSSHAEQALEDLARAGLPPTAGAIVVSVDEIWGLAGLGDESKQTESRAGATGEAGALAARAAERIQTIFPGWTVRPEAYAGSPARIIIERAEEWRADLLVVGAQSHNTAGRLLLGSVAQRVATEAHCSTRIARFRAPQDHPLRIIIGLDGSPNADAAVRAVASRRWPHGAEVKLLTSLLRAPLTTETHPPQEWPDAREMQLAAANELQAAGLSVSYSIEEGDPKRVLLEEAERWSADSIFVGATSLQRITRFMLGSVPTALLTRASCSVEVTRIS